MITDNKLSTNTGDNKPVTDNRAISAPVAVFDSGVGGISVLRELTVLLPDENFRYFGDSANAPYGTKSGDEVRKLTLKCVGRLIEDGAKAVVIACNTATSAAAEYVRRSYGSVPIIGMEPELKTAALNKEHPHVLVMATPVTLKLEKFMRLMSAYKDKANIELLPCPGLVELVENGKLDGKETEEFISQLLMPYIGAGIDSVVLGCTHYPFVKPVIQRIMGDDTEIYDGGAGTARELRRRLLENGILNDSGEKGTVTFENSRNTVQEIELCKKLFYR